MSHLSTNAPPRPRPVLLAQSILAAVGAIVGTAGFAEQIPARAAWWIFAGLAAVNLGLGFYLQGLVTPLSQPQDARGVDLVPADTQVITTRDTRTTVVSPANEPDPDDTIPDAFGSAGLSWTQPDRGETPRPRPDL